MRIMSYNLRMDTPHDGEMAWPHREPAVKWVWEEIDADIVGIQEGLPHQVAALDAWFPRYARVGRGRNADGSGECVAIYYKRDRWTLKETGDFWLSDTPEVPGSRTWGNNIPRIATWARLTDRDGVDWFILNTHLDHQSEEARVRGAEQIVRFLAERVQEAEHVVVTGDFNAQPDTEPMARFLAAGLSDCLAASGEGTFHGYTGTPRARIDYILAGEGVECRAARVVMDKPFDLWPSDHFPIYADLVATRKSAAGVHPSV